MSIDLEALAQAEHNRASHRDGSECRHDWFHGSAIGPVNRSDAEWLAAEYARLVPEDEGRLRCCDDPTPSTHNGQPYCEACDATLVPASAAQEAAWLAQPFAPDYDEDALAATPEPRCEHNIPRSECRIVGCSSAWTDPKG